MPKVSYSFEKLNQFFKSEKDRIMLASSFYTHSLCEIMDNSHSDFQAEREEGSFIHALELINDRELDD